jgi:hypothetical protein
LKAIEKTGSLFTASGGGAHEAARCMIYSAPAIAPIKEFLRLVGRTATLMRVR